ncbi:MAG: hypothetical protein ACK5ZP_02890 [Betaproteobacteria bacterium]|nr:hypothetical protein [Rhodocyclaceae bacterium]
MSAPIISPTRAAGLQRFRSVYLHAPGRFIGMAVVMDTTHCIYHLFSAGTMNHAVRGAAGG